MILLTAYRGLCTRPAVRRNKRKGAHPSAGKNKNSGRSIDLPLLVHTPAFTSRSTVFGKQSIILSAQKHAHGHHTHAHLAHHHGSAATLHAAFLLAVFAEVGRIITLSPPNVNPICVFWRFFQKSTRHERTFSCHLP
ncbi:MAG: hypothetical protein ACLVGP_02685 [Oscillospiraceae bacterium]